MSKPKYQTIISVLVLALVVSLQWPGRTSWTILRPLPVGPAVTDGSIVESEAYRIALRFFSASRLEFKNKKYITIIDYTKPSSSKRLFLIDMETGAVEKYLVSHGKNSGWNYARKFSNRPGSFQSSKGFFRTGEKFRGTHGACLELNGLERGVNDNALARGIVMHGASYAGAKSIGLNRGRLGRSLGCPAVPAEVAEKVIDKIKNGSLLYVHAK